MRAALVFFSFIHSFIHSSIVTRRRLTRVSSCDATQTLAGVADKIKNFAIIYLVDINEVRARVSMRANAGERASERRLEKTNKD
jgi:hypothetical protein